MKENLWDLVAGEYAHGLDVAVKVLFFSKDLQAVAGGNICSCKCERFHSTAVSFSIFQAGCLLGRGLKLLVGFGSAPHGESLLCTTELLQHPSTSGCNVITVVL